MSGNFVACHLELHLSPKRLVFSLISLFLHPLFMMLSSALTRLFSCKLTTYCLALSFDALIVNLFSYHMSLQWEVFPIFLNCKNSW